MKFSGNIEDFPVMDIMQYIHTGKKAGTLCLESNFRQGWVHFQDGQVIRARRAGMTSIGDLLLEKNMINSNDLKAAVRIQQVQPNAKPLGMILEEMGAITHKALKDAVIRQIEEVIYELVTWEEGTFSFELESYELFDDISIAPDNLIPPEEIDTKFLLLEAMRIFEEEKNRDDGFQEFFEDKREQAGSQLSETCSEEAQTSHPVFTTGAIENLEQCIPLLKSMLNAGRKKDKTQSISIYFLKIISEHLDRAILFLVRKGELLGLGAFGETNDRRSLNEKTRNLRLPLEEGSLLAHCTETRSPFYGEAEKEAWLNVLYEKIGAPERPEVMILPVAGVERVICLVYGDNGYAAKPLCRSELLEIAAGQAGMIFENTVLQKQVKRKAH